MNTIAIVGGSNMPEDSYEKEMTAKMSKDEKRIYKTWSNKSRAESDVYTLAEAQEIKDDAERHKMAMACAKERAKKMQKISK